MNIEFGDGLLGSDQAPDESAWSQTQPPNVVLFFLLRSPAIFGGTGGSPQGLVTSKI